VVLYWRGLAKDQAIEVPIDVVAPGARVYRGPAEPAYCTTTADAKEWVRAAGVAIAAEAVGGRVDEMWRDPPTGRVAPVSSCVCYPSVDRAKHARDRSPTLRRGPSDGRQRHLHLAVQATQAMNCATASRRASPPATSSWAGAREGPKRAAGRPRRDPGVRRRRAQGELLHHLWSLPRVRQNQEERPIDDRRPKSARAGRRGTAAVQGGQLERKRIAIVEDGYPPFQVPSAALGGTYGGKW